MDKLLWLEEHWLDICGVLTSIVGTATVVFTTLERWVVPMRNWALTTKTTYDDRAVDELAWLAKKGLVATHAVSAALLWAGKWIAPLALRGTPATAKTSFAPPPLSSPKHLIELGRGDPANDVVELDPGEPEP